MDVKACNEIFNHIEEELNRLHLAIISIAIDLYANKADTELIKLLSDISALVIEYKKKVR